MSSITTPALTDPQRAFVIDMLHVVFPDQDADEVLAAAITRGAFATRADTRASIDALIIRRNAVRADSRKAPVASVRPVVAAGCYALPIAGSDDGWAFYRVVEGKVPGRVFVNRFRSDALDRMTWPQQQAVLADIAVDAEGAGVAFMERSERCRRCGHRLTDLPTARANGGWGPDCVLLMGR